MWVRHSGRALRGSPLTLHNTWGLLQDGSDGEGLAGMARPLSSCGADWAGSTGAGGSRMISLTDGRRGVDRH